jgi:hypothetical protein
MKGRDTAQFAALIGIDWANAKHDICLQPGDSPKRESGAAVDLVGMVGAPGHPSRSH